VESTRLSLHVINQRFVNAVVDDAKEPKVFAGFPPSASDIFYRANLASHQRSEVNHWKWAMVIVRDASVVGLRILHTLNFFNMSHGCLL
jgi:hypothetical protein